MVLDRLTEVAQFITTMTNVIALGVAKLFVKEIFVNYELPREIICDRDRNSWVNFRNLCSNCVVQNQYGFYISFGNK